MSDDELTTSGGTSRRDVLRRGGIVLGLAWSAPVIQSLASPAFATGSEAGHGLCDRLVFVKWRVECSDRKSFWVGQEDYAHKKCYTDMVWRVLHPPSSSPVLQQPIPSMITPAKFAQQTQSWAWIKGEKSKIYAAYDSRHQLVKIKAPDDCRVVAYQVYYSTTKGCPVTVVNGQPFPQELDSSVSVPTLATTSTSSRIKKKLVAVSMILCCND